MKNLKLSSKRLFLHYEFPIHVGELKATLEAMITVYYTDKVVKKYDCEFMDATNISYLNKPIVSEEKWNEFVSVNKNIIGVDFEEILNKAFADVMTKATLNKIIKAIHL